MNPVDLDSAWDVHPQVSIRPEPFGALLYHFGTRKLSFLKDRALLGAVQALADSSSVREAFASAGIRDGDSARYQSALGTLAASSMVIERH